MGQIYEINFHELVVEFDLPKIDALQRRRILLTIENKPGLNPLHFGKPLRYTLKPYRSLRVGNYRIVYKLKNQTIFILAIFHRGDGYDHILKRS